MMRIIHEHDPLILVFLKRFRVPEQDRDDVAQECRLAMLREPTTGPYWHCLRVCSAWTRQRIDARERMIAMTDLGLRPGMRWVEPYAREPGPDARLDAQELLSRLPGRWARLLWLQALGWTGPEIGAMEGISRAGVCNVTTRARERLRA